MRDGGADDVIKHERRGSLALMLVPFRAEVFDETKYRSFPQTGSGCVTLTDNPMSTELAPAAVAAVLDFTPPFELH